MRSWCFYDHTLMQFIKMQTMIFLHSVLVRSVSFTDFFANRSEIASFEKLFQSLSRLPLSLHFPSFLEKALICQVAGSKFSSN